MHHSMTNPSGRCVMVNCGDRLPQHWPLCFDVLWVSLHVIYTENSLCPLLRSSFSFHTLQSPFLSALIQHRPEGNSMEARFHHKSTKTYLWLYISQCNLISCSLNFVSHNCNSISHNVTWSCNVFISFTCDVLIAHYDFISYNVTFSQCFFIFRNCFS